jgi:signal transduction histidine kinase
MSDTIIQLQWLSRLDGPLVTVHAIDANQVVSAALSRLRYIIEIKGIVLDISPALPSALANDMWMEEVFANLIGNAVKFMGENNPSPRIRISGGRAGYRARYEIQDNGIGIAKDDLPLLFDPVLRLKQSDHRQGLGLAIVKRIVNRLGGSVGVESTVGQGSTFWFTLPAGGSRSERFESLNGDALG